DTEPEEAVEVINAAREAMPMRDGAPSAAHPREAMPAGFARSKEAMYAEPANYSGSAPAAFELDEGFSELLFQLIDERGWKDADCYKKANVSKQVFSNIRSNPQYLPSKTTVLALAIALELDLDETKKLLERAGYAISHSSLADVIVEYFIIHKRYNIFEINQTLFEHDQKILGSK
ncbi:MAG: RNase III inhibitor, partial [Lachnospiraceae bacterium]|nr:RNase III inhibitor [Lachnospiraceae bacterium]